jgi:drug/metabolite transporter (DMT)-like permease
MLWQFLIFGYLVLGAGAYLIRRRLAVTFAEHSRIINGVFFIALLYPVGLIVASFTSPNLSIGWLNVMLLLLGSGVFPIINLLAYKASKDVDAGLYTISQNLVPIVTIASAWVLLHEKLNDQQLLGSVIIIVSAFLATLPKFNSRTKNSSAGMVFALSAVFLLGFAIVYERWMLTRVDFGAYLVYGWGAQTLWMAVLAWPKRAQLKMLNDKKTFLQVLAYGITNTFKGLCMVGALALSGNASIVGASTGFMAALVVLAAYFILKEKEHLWFKIAAAIVGAVGIIVLNTA